MYVLNNFAFLNVNMKQRLSIKVNRKIRKRDNFLEQTEFIFQLINISP